MEAWLEFIWRSLQVALGIGLVIFVHELGHFLVAKWAGIRVEVFSLGFGPRLLGFRRGPTDYRLSLVPLGGYVRMAGESPDDERTGADDEFAAKPVGARAAVITAGVVMNAIFAVVCFLVAFKIGVSMTHPAVGRVQPGSAAHEAGLRYGDVVLEIDGERPLEFMDLGLAAAYAAEDLDLTIERRGEKKRIAVRPRRAAGSPVQQLGFEKMDEVAEVRAGSAAERAGLAAGDWVLGVDGKPVTDFADFTDAVRASPDRPLRLDLRRRDGRYETVELVPASVPARTYGVRFATTPVLGKISSGMPAEAAGLRPDDAILEIDGAKAELGNLKPLILAKKPGEPMRIDLLRDGQRLEVSLAPKIDEVTGVPMIGVTYGLAIVGEVAPGSPAEKAGIRPGDRVAALQGKPAVFDDPEGLDRIANTLGADAEPLDLTIARAGPGGGKRRASLAPAPVPDRFVGDAGVLDGDAAFTMVVPGVLAPIRLGFDRTVTFMHQVLLTFRGMFTKRIDPSTLGGPIGIAEAAYRVAQHHGIGKLLYFLAIISVNLAVLNILPIPILDGGHLVFLGIEKIKGSPVAINVQIAAQWVGLALLLGLMIFVTKNDIVRWLGS